MADNVWANIIKNLGGQLLALTSRDTHELCLLVFDSCEMEYLCLVDSK